MICYNRLHLLLYYCLSEVITVFGTACRNTHVFLRHTESPANSTETIDTFSYSIMGVEESVYLAKLAEQAERYEGWSYLSGVIKPC